MKYESFSPDSNHPKDHEEKLSSRLLFNFCRVFGVPPSLFLREVRFGMGFVSIKFNLFSEFFPDFQLLLFIIKITFGLVWIYSCVHIILIL